MEKKINEIQVEVQEGLARLSRIQPKKDVVKYFEVCSEIFRFYNIANSILYIEKQKLTFDMFRQVLNKLVYALEQEY